MQLVNKINRLQISFGWLQIGFGWLQCFNNANEKILQRRKYCKGENILVNAFDL